MYEPLHDNPENLANSIIAFLMSKLTRSKKSINLCTKPVSNLKAEYSYEIILCCLNKANECN